MKSDNKSRGYVKNNSTKTGKVFHRKMGTRYYTDNSRVRKAKYSFDIWNYAGERVTESTALCMNVPAFHT
jgi:hypothetical protein